MAFPITPLPLVGEMLISGTWVDISAAGDIRADDGVTISGRGTPNEGSSLSSAVCNFKLNNPLGKYSNRNPNSQYFEQLPQNTPVRFSAGTGNAFMVYPTDLDPVWVETVDKAVLDLTGDLDIRGDFSMACWLPFDNTSCVFAAKYVITGDQRSWFVGLGEFGHLLMGWSPDGTFASRIVVNSTERVNPAGGRKAFRVTLDVDNGAAGNTVTFYTSDTIGGSWTQLGDPVVTAGTTSVFASTAALTVGRTAAAAFGEDELYGDWYGFELRNGIGGTLVADADFTVQTIGDTSWSDGLGTPNTWTVNGTAGEIAPANRRFTGEIAQMPVEWDTTGNDVWIPVQANDITRRLTQGEDALRSPLFRFIDSDAIVNFGTTIGYWPMEDASGSTQAAAVVGAQPASATDITFGPDSLLPSSEGVAEFTSTSSKMGAACVSAATPTTCAFTFLFWIPTRPAGENSMFSVRSTGTQRRWDIQLGNTTMRVKAFDEDGVQTVDTPVIDGLEPNLNYCIVSLDLEQNGGNVDWALQLTDVTTAGGFGFLTGSVAGTVGRFTSWVTGSMTNLVGLKVSHVFVVNGISDGSLYQQPFLDAALAFVGETAAARLRRLAAEEGVPVQICGPTASTEPMGPQTATTLFDLYRECADVDGGILFTPREFLGYRYRTRRSLINQDGLALSYSGGDLSGDLKPIPDDQLLRNDVTISRPNGSEGRSVRDDGPKGVDTVGRYKTRYPLNAQLDARLEALAQWATHLGTWDEDRYPTVQVDLAHATFVADAAKSALAASADVGDHFRLTGMPDFLPPGDVELLARGVTERLDNHRWQIIWNASPYGPYRANDLTGSTQSRRRAAATNSALANDVTSSATSLVVKTPTGAMWRRSSSAPADTYPMDVRLGGEVVTATALANVTFTFVAAGTAAHNTGGFSVTPGLPAGLAAADVMVLFAAIRDTATTVNTPTGWTVLTSLANVTLFGRIAGSSEAAPTVTFTGGGAGDDTSAQIAAFRPSSALSATSALTDFVARALWSTNASAQDIAYGPVSVSGVRLDNAVVLYLGWKADDWTSVASPGTEIGEPDTTTGDDQGLVWAYTIQTTATAIPAGSFVVTGGAGAVSKGAVVVIHPRHQVMTVTRSTNLIVKAQTADTVVQVADPFYVTL